MIKLLFCWNRVRCRPFLAHEEVATVVASISRFHEPEARRAVTHDSRAPSFPLLQPRRLLNRRGVSFEEQTDGSRDLFRLLEQDHVAPALDLSHLATR